jgi:hypothetical protein
MTKIGANAFKSLSELKKILIEENKIEAIKTEIFKNNQKLHSTQIKFK